MPECLEQRKGNCDGETILRESLTGTGTPIARCDFHQELRLQKQEVHEVIYPDSPHPPEWFDPSYAGEYWDSDY